MECAQVVWDTGSAMSSVVVLLVGHNPELDTEALASSELREPELASMPRSKDQGGRSSGVLVPQALRYKPRKILKK